MIPHSSKKLLPLPPLLPAQSAPLSQLRPTQSAPTEEAGRHVSRKPPSLRQHPIRPGEPDHAAASLWPHHRSRVTPADSSPLTGASVAASFQEQEQEEEEEERLAGAPPRGPHGELVRVLMAAMQGRVASVSALPEECLIQSAHASRQRSCLHDQRERERERESRWGGGQERATASGEGGREA